MKFIYVILSLKNNLMNWGTIIKKSCWNAFWCINSNSLHLKVSWQTFLPTRTTKHGLTYSDDFIDKLSTRLECHWFQSNEVGTCMPTQKPWIFYEAAIWMEQYLAQTKQNFGKYAVLLSLKIVASEKWVFALHLTRYPKYMFWR